MMIRIRIVKKSKITNKILVGRLNHYVHQLVKIKQMRLSDQFKDTNETSQQLPTNVSDDEVSINRIVKQI